MKTLAHLYTRVFDVPLAIQQSKLDTLLGVIGDRLGIDATIDQLEAANKPFKSQKQSYEVQDGIAVIGITGTLMKKSSGLMAASGSASYETIGAQFQDAMKNPNIKGILLDVDSPGGETSGLFELGDMLSSYKGSKPVYAVANDGAYSAAYAIACCADKIFLTRTAGVGSIGVICCHVDQSGSDEMKGMKYTMIHAGSKKADGNSHEPLSESALNDTLAEVNRQYEMFCSLVAKNRKVSLDAIRETEAGVCFADNAIPLLADQVGTFEDAMSALCAACDTASALNSSVVNHKVIKSVTTLNKEVSKPMANKTELSIDELVAKAAEAKSTDEYMDDATDAQSEADDAKDKAKEKQDDADDEAEEADDAQDRDGEDDEDEDGEDKKKAMKADFIRIVNLCTIAKMPSLAADFLANGYTVAEVEKALLKQRAQKSKTVKVASSNSKPAVDFTSAAQAILSDENIAPEKRAEAYRKYLMNHKVDYLQSMLKRNQDNRSGQNYSFLKQRGY